MDIQIEPEIMNLVSTVENDISRAIAEALNLWLEQKIITCPITRHFCRNHKGSCNECTVLENRES